MWLFLQSKLTLAQCQQLYGLERDIKHPGILAHKFNQFLKSFIIPVLEMEAQDHVVQRMYSLSCPYRPSFPFLEWLNAQTLHFVGAVPRYSILRWALGEDSDLWFTFVPMLNIIVPVLSPVACVGAQGVITHSVLPAVLCVITVA